MYDVEKVARGFLRTYNLAPSPSTFYILSKGLIGTVDQLLREFQELPAATKKKYTRWNHATIIYRARLEQEYLQSVIITDMVNAGDPDWNKALQAGNDYAIALKNFFMDGDSSQWATQANQLAEIKSEQIAEKKAGFNKVTWLTALWGGPAAGAWMAITETLLEGAGDAITEQVKDTTKAAGEALGDAGEFLEKAGIGIGILAVIGIAAYLAWD